MQHATGPLNLVASPLRLRATPPEYRLAPPLLGEHTAEILRDVLAIQPAEIARLRREGIV
jgi:crotonobetainyl-CoA:carnitine CoA-transferase CaiB-like acyl-CoA transferase